MKITTLYACSEFPPVEIMKRHQNYVPHGLIPGKYGDTIELKIAADGTITNWPKRPDLDEFFGDSESDD